MYEPMEPIPKEYDFDNVMILPLPSTLSSRSEVKLERTFNFINIVNEDDSDEEGYVDKKINKVWTGIPIIASNMDSTGTFEVYNILKNHKILTALNKFYNLNDYKNAENKGIHLDPDYFMVTTGIPESDEKLENLQEIINYTKCKWICIDVANGYMDSFVTFCRYIRELYPDKIIVAGNVVTAEMVYNLVKDGGVDVIKVGIGSGSACLTRRQTGVGRPQLSAIKECSDMCNKLRQKGYKVYIISDGGIKYPGDMSKAFAVGADFVMAGGIFAGHDENPGEIIEEDNKKYKLFYGMSSKYAMEKHFGKMENYRSSEGAVLKIPYKGPLENTINDFLGGIRSTCTYIGADTIEKIPQRSFIIAV